MFRDVTDDEQTPLRRDAERNRMRILDAARDVFAARGFAASFNEIACRADVAVATVYRRFPTRQSLVDALFEERMKEIVVIFESAEEEPDGWVAFAGALERLLEVVAGDRGTWELLMSGEHGGRSIAEHRESLGACGEKLLRRAQEQGSVRADLEPSDLPLLQLELGSLANATRDVDRDVWRRFLTITLDGIRAKPRKPTPLAADALADDLVADAMRSAVSPASVQPA